MPSRPKQTMAYTTEIPVRFGDIDHARVVYYPRFFHMFHRAFERWFDEALGISYPEVVQRVGFPSVHVETDFRKTLSYGESARITIEVVKVGSKSLTLKYTLHRVPDGELSAEATITTVCIDGDFKSTTIPDDLRDRFEKYKASQGE